MKNILYINTQHGMYNGVIEYKEQLKKLFTNDKNLNIEFGYLKGCYLIPNDTEKAISINAKFDKRKEFNKYSLIHFSNISNPLVLEKVKFFLENKDKFNFSGKIAITIHQGNKSPEYNIIIQLKEHIERFNIILITNSLKNKIFYESIFNTQVINLNLPYTRRNSERNNSFTSLVKKEQVLCNTRIANLKRIEDVLKLKNNLPLIFSANYMKVRESGTLNYSGLGNKKYCESILQMNKELGNPGIFLNDDTNKLELLKESKFGIDGTKFFKDEDNDRFQYTLLEYMDFNCIPVLKEGFFGDCIKENVNGISFETYENLSLIEELEKERIFNKIILNNNSLLEDYCNENKNLWFNFYNTY